MKIVAYFIGLKILELCLLVLLATGYNWLCIFVSQILLPKNCIAYWLGGFVCIIICAMVIAVFISIIIGVVYLIKANLRWAKKLAERKMT